MSTEIQRRGGTTVEHASFTGLEREITIDTDKKTVVVHDGVTAGGFPLSASSHTHTADEIFGGSGITLSVSAGGTGASVAAAALDNLGGAPQLSNTEYVSNQSAFALAYSGGPKTILLGANSYTMPATFVPGVNLVHQGSFDEVRLTGDLNAAISGASALITTVWQGITIDGNIFVSNPFDTTFELVSCEHINGAMNINASTVLGTVRYVLGCMEQFNVGAANLKMIGTQITGDNSTITGGNVRLLSVTAEVDSSSVLVAILQQSGGTSIIQNMRWQNPTGRGINLTGGETTIDGYILSGSAGGDGLVFAGSAILNLGTHNLPTGKLVDGGGTLVPLKRPIEANSIATTEIESGAIKAGQIASSAVTGSKLSEVYRQFHKDIILPVVTASAGSTSKVIWGYINGYDQLLSIRMQTLASTVVTADVEVRLHEVRVAGSAFPPVDSILASGISVGRLLASNTLSASVGTGRALSLEFTNFAGGSALTDLMVNLTFRI